PGAPIAVAFAVDGRLLVQTRDPAALVVTSPATTPAILLHVPLSLTARDTGFEIFNQPTRAGIACMSCHPEGGDDGHTWFFGEDSIGGPFHPRRTQSLRGGILGTAPFHWNGDM